MSNRFTIIFSIALFATSLIVNAQPITRYNTFSYNVNEGMLQSTIAGLAFDKNNFCWISYPNGIQKFDGKKFTDIRIQPGLADNKSTRLFESKKGDILISHNNGVSRYDAESNKIIQIYSNDAGDKNLPAFIGEDAGIIYIFSDAGIITGFSSSNFKIVFRKQTGIVPTEEYGIHFSDNIINHKVGLTVNYCLQLLDLTTGMLLKSSPAIPKISQFFIRLKNENEILFCTYTAASHIQAYNFFTGKTSPLIIKGIEPFTQNRCNIFMRKNSALVAVNNKLYETDTALTFVKWELVNFQNTPVADKSTIAHIGEDHFGNIFLQTITAGIKKIIGRNFPIKYYGTVKKENNNIISLLPVKNKNMLLAGTVGNGLLVFDTMQQLIKNIQTLPGDDEPFSTNCIVQKPDGNFLFFNTGENKIWALQNNFAVNKFSSVSSSLPENKRGVPYFGNKLYCDKNNAFIQCQQKIYRVNFAGRTITEHEISSSYIMGGMLHGNNIVTHGGDELFFIDTGTFKTVKRIPFKNTAYVRCFTHDADGNIFIGSNNGIYKTDGAGKIIEHFTRQNGLPDDCIYAMLFDDAGALWCSTNKGIFRLDKDKNIFLLRREDGLQENEFNTNVAAKAADGEMFFGGVNGISSFYPEAINNTADNVRLLCTQIKVNNNNIFTDTAAWNINAIELPYHQNLLSFDFVAMGSNNPDQYVYQYKMDGIDEQWLQNEDLQTVRYFLPPGKYVFKIFASRFFDKDAKAMKEIHIIIHAPFYKTWWFFVGIALLFAGLMMYAVNRFNKNKYRKKLMELRNEHKLQLERERISRDLHDSLGAYANAVLYNTELLQQETNTQARNELMNDLKFASKDIITSLRETVWALKKDSYTAEECMLRIKNFIQPLSKYYPAIHFAVNAENIDKTIVHSKALNLVRMVQEAVTNAIKHATAKNILITSTIENNRWQITVTDDGKGFDYQKKEAEGMGNGLDNLKQRAADSDIYFKIESAEKTGTIITIVL